MQKISFKFDAEDEKIFEYETFHQETEFATHASTDVQLGSEGRCICFERLGEIVISALMISIVLFVNCLSEKLAFSLPHWFVLLMSEFMQTECSKNHIPCNFNIDFLFIFRGCDVILKKLIHGLFVNNFSLAYHLKYSFKGVTDKNLVSILWLLFYQSLSGANYFHIIADTIEEMLIILCILVWLCSHTSDPDYTQVG